MKPLPLFLPLLVPLLLLLLASPAQARIGETPAECTARYGQPVTVDAETQGTLYKKAGVQVACFFAEGRCDFIHFKNLRKHADGTSVPFTDAERKILLEASSGGRAWVLSASDDRDTSWTCGDLRARQRHQGDRYLIIQTRAHVERSAASDAREKEAKARENLKDF